MAFPIDVKNYKPLELDLAQQALSPEQLDQLKTNIQIVRDTIVFFTAVGGVKGLDGHTGGAYSIVPETLIADGFMRGADNVYPAFFDEGGHRVALQYAMAAFNGDMPFDKLLHHREYGHGLYGHPEINPELGIKFSSGRLGHIWPFINGIAKANPDKAVFMLGSDGSQQEGNDAEAARLAVAQNLNIKLVIDDNNVTISGHPQEYLPGFDVARTLEGHGLTVEVVDGEDLEALYNAMQKAFTTDGPVAVVARRPMCPGMSIEGQAGGHGCVKKDVAIEYLTSKGQNDAVDYINNMVVEKPKVTYLGSSEEVASNRNEFGKIVSGILDNMPLEERVNTLLVVDSDLEGSTGIINIHKPHPEVYINGGVQERGNFSAAAGFGFEKGKQGIFSTFSAFIEMIVSEATMARLNEARVICHFSHAGIDDMCDNTCHYGTNIFLANTGLPEGDTTRMYFAADAIQLKSMVETIWNDEGVRYVFTTRSKAPFVLNEDGTKLYGDDYKFVPGKDEIVREGTAGYVISYGAMLYRALDAVERARQQGIDVGLINKPTLNVVDEEMITKAGNSPFILVVEDQNANTGLGALYGTKLLERCLTPKYGSMAVTKPGEGGVAEQMPFHGLSPDDILKKIKEICVV